MCIFCIQAHVSLRHSDLLLPIHSTLGCNPLSKCICKFFLRHLAIAIDIIKSLHVGRRLFVCHVLLEMELSDRSTFSYGLLIALFLQSRRARTVPYHFTPARVEVSEDQHLSIDINSKRIP